MRLRELRLSTRITISTLIIVAAGAATLAFVENSRIHDAYISDLRTHLKTDLETEKLRLNQAIEALRQDVLFLSNTPPVAGIVRAALNHGYDPRYGNTHRVWAERLEQIFTAFSQAHPNYFKIRYIGVADGGREIVRVTNREGKIEVTPSAKLQSKGGREYFKAASGLKKGQVHFSEFDLSEEWGVNERPNRTTLRASTPVFTPAGETFGVVVISLDVAGLLRSAERSLPRGTRAYIADASGQYLLNTDSKEATGPGSGSGNKITMDFPFVETMFNLRTPEYLPLQPTTTPSGDRLICAMRLHFDPTNRSRFILLLHAIPAAVAEEQIATIPVQQIGGGFIGMLLIGGIAMIVLRRTFAPLKELTEAADKIADGKYDGLLPQQGAGEIGSLTKSLNTMLTQLWHRELSLLESEARYRRLYESMMDAFVMTDMSGRFLQFNHVYREMLGYSAEELLRLTYVDLTPEKWREYEARIVTEQIIPHGKSQVYEKEYIRKDGTVFPVELRTFLLRDENNQPEAMCAIVRDITERKRSEILVQQFGSLLQGSFNEIYMFDANSLHFILTSEGAKNNLGYSADELLQLTPVDLKPSFTEESFRQLVAPLRNGDQAFLFFDTVHRRKDGTTYPVEVRMQLMQGEHPVFVAIVQDITERRQADMGLRKSAEEIADLYNRAPCGYHSLDKDGIIRQINDTELAWLGYAREEVIWKLKWPDLLTPESAQIFRKTLSQLIQHGNVSDIEAEIIRKDGTTFIGLINASAVYDSTGEFVMSRTTVVDITERKRVERHLQELSAHLQTIREEEKSRIAREIHDDLGGTLTALKIEAYRLASELSANNKTAPPSLKRVYSMSDLLDSAVNVTRRIITDLRPTILDDLGLLAALEWQAEQFQKRSGISCQVHCVEDKGVTDQQYSIALFRIFQETLTNVARHSGASSVEVEYHCDGEEAMLSVNDNGRGMPEGYAIAPTSFGMRGMSERAEQLGGKIKFESPPEGGFRVTVILPLPGQDKKEEKS